MKAGGTLMASTTSTLMAGDGFTTRGVLREGRSHVSFVISASSDVPFSASCAADGNGFILPDGEMFMLR